MSETAFKFAHKFIKEGLDQPRNTKRGNMKLQKLLYFSYLVHLAEFDQRLFKEPIYAYENGCIVEDVMNTYYHQHESILNESYETNTEFTPEEQFTISLVTSVFGDMSGLELRYLNHEHESWKLAHNRSYVNEAFKNKHKSEIDENEVLRYDIDGIKDAIEAYKDNEGNTSEAVYILDGTEFYYDPSEITIDDELKGYLKSFIGDEEVFTIYNDASQGVIVY